MALKDKLKKLRTDRSMTQETVANSLGVSSQTVSKWERGLLSPDIALLPKIALLFRCSIDSLFNMELSWGIDHRKEFEAKLRELHTKRDIEGVYRAWMEEIELNPDYYANYPDVMLYVLRNRLFDDGHVEKMISLAEHAEKYCTNDDIRNEIYRIMLQICSEAEAPRFKETGKRYYSKLPMLRHSREVYAKFVMDAAEYRAQMKQNVIYLTDLAECAIRQLILPEMTPEEKMFYYRKAAALYEAVLDGKYGGFYDPPLASNYYHLAILSSSLGKEGDADGYTEKILTMAARRFDTEREESILLFASSLPNTTPPEKLWCKLLQKMLSAPELEKHREAVAGMLEKYSALCAAQTKSNRK